MLSHYHVYFKSYSGKLYTHGRPTDTPEQAEFLARQFREAVKMAHDTSVRIRSIKVGLVCHCPAEWISIPEGYEEE